MSRNGIFSMFEDQHLFMESTEQPRGIDTAGLYVNLVTEEYGELMEAWSKIRYRNYASTEDVPTDDIAEVADACIDIIYVTAGVLNALGLNGDELWKEVQRSNMSKLVQEDCPECHGTGYVGHRYEHGEVVGECPNTCCRGGHVYVAKRRDDGKILKPAGYSPPKLVEIVARNLKR